MTSNFQRIIGYSLTIFLCAAVFVDWRDFYRFFFFAGVMVPVLYLYFFRHSEAFGWRNDLLVRTQVALILWLSFNSLVMSVGSWADRFDQVRWGLEILVLMAGVMTVVPFWIARARLFGLLLCGMVAIAGLMVLVPYLLEGDFDVRLTGPGFLGHPIQGASTLLVLWTMGLCLLALSNKVSIYDTCATLLSASVILVFAVLTQSRGPIVAALVLFTLALVGFIFAGSGIARKKRQLFLVSLGLVIAVAAIGLMAPEEAENWLHAVLTSRGLSYRPEIWSATLAHAQDYWLLGAGSAVDFVDLAVGAHLLETMGLTFDHTHNLFLQIFLVGGLVGLGLFLFALVQIIVRTCRSEDVARSVCLSLLVAAMLLVNLTDTVRLLVSPSADWVLFWIPMFFITALICQPKDVGLFTDAPKEKVKEHHSMEKKDE